MISKYLYLRSSLVFLGCIISLFIHAQGCPQNTMDTSTDQKSKVEKAAYQKLQYLIAGFQILVDPEVNPIIKADTKESILEGFFMDKNLNPRDPNLLVYELNINPTELKPSKKSLATYLDYLMSRSDNRQPTKVDWCFPPIEENPIDFNQTPFSDDIVGLDTCSYFPYRDSLYVGEQLLIRYDEIPYYKFLCRRFILEARARFTRDVEKDSTYFEWVPLVKSMLNGGNKCGKDKDCNSIIPPTSDGETDSLDHIKLESFKYDFGHGDNPSSEYIPINGGNGWKTNYFSFVDTSKIIETVSRCETMDGVDPCFKRLEEDFIVLKPEAELRLHPISSGKYTVFVYTGDLDTNQVQESYTLNVEGKKRPWLKFEPGEVKLLVFNVEVEEGDDAINIKTEGGGYNRINAVIIKPIDYKYDFGPGLLQEGTKPVGPITYYDNIQNYGFEIEKKYRKDFKFNSYDSRLVDLSVADSILADYLEINKTVEFKIDMPTAPYDVKIFVRDVGVDDLKLKVENKKFKVKSDSLVPGSEFRALSSKVKVGKDKQMNFLFDSDDFNIQQIAGIEIINNDLPELIIPWWHYLVPAPGFAYETIRKKQNKRFPIFMGVLSGAAYFCTYKAIKHKIDSDKAYDLHTSTSLIRVNMDAYEKAKKERNKALFYGGKALGIWLLSNGYAYWRDQKIRKRNAGKNPEENGLGYNSLPPSNLGPSRYAPSLRINPDVSVDSNGETQFAFQFNLKF